MCGSYYWAWLVRTLPLQVASCVKLEGGGCRRDGKLRVHGAEMYAHPCLALRCACLARPFVPNGSVTLDQFCCR